MAAAAITNPIMYLGHCSCPKRFREGIQTLAGMPAGYFRHADRQSSGAPSAGRFKVCFMVPPVTPGLIPDFERLLSLIGDSKEAELSLNDWGSLRRCSILKKEGTLKTSLTAGVLLAAQDTDPLLAVFCKKQEPKAVVVRDVTGKTTGSIMQAEWQAPSAQLNVHWGTPSIVGIMPLLREMGVGRIELCVQPLPFPETLQEEGMPVTFIRESILSVIPCRGDCGNCKEILNNMTGIKRGHGRISGMENLITADLSMEAPVWADRSVSLLSH